MMLQLRYGTGIQSVSDLRHLEAEPSVLSLDLSITIIEWQTAWFWLTEEQ
jgi:hypothetical protein